MEKANILPVVVLFLLCGIETSFGQAIPEEARRHFGRGIAAVEVANTPADYEKAITEFEKAKSLAPDWPEVFYNLGLIQEKAERYRNAIESLKQYLRLAPNASDAANVKERIYKLEYKAENVLTRSDIADILVSFGKLVRDSEGNVTFIGKWRRAGTCNYDIYDLIQREGPDSVRVPTHYATFDPPVKRFRTLKVEGPIVEFTTKDRNWSLNDPHLVNVLGTEGRPYDVHIEVVSREHVIVKEKITHRDGSSEFCSSDYFRE